MCLEFTSATSDGACWSLTWLIYLISLEEALAIIHGNILWLVSILAKLLCTGDDVTLFTMPGACFTRPSKSSPPWNVSQAAYVIHTTDFYILGWPHKAVAISLLKIISITITSAICICQKYFSPNKQCMWSTFSTSLIFEFCICIITTWSEYHILMG